ncbi:MAG: undecaprenyl/decaprenyl-phosphate alpha-N-acetylglucosaminyl 1-phosphate transferase [Clostridia bacterium]|nr:undecaprenyl/decaprenyl-phosphate alpha-N-acetylglucosaminyl 1-phosphate transferase [Clostridia bacterium]
MEQAKIFAAAGVALALSFALTPLTMHLAYLVGAVDVPRDERRMHTSPVPRMGGVAIFFAFLIPSALLGMAQATLSYWLAGATLLVLLGLLDDVFRLPALVKLGFQILASAMAVGGGGGFAFLRLWDISLSPGVWSAPLSVVWLLVCINAHNMIDGLDGLSAGVSTVEAFALSVIFALQGNAALSGAALLVCGACLGYLPYNRHPARVFMGDTGSQFLGFVLGSLALSVDQREIGSLGVLVPLLVLALPLSDLIFAVVRRLLRGQSPFAADRGHWHHRLCDAGLSQRQACFWMVLLSALMGCAATLICRQEWYGYAAFALLWAVAALMCMRLAYGRGARRT